MYPRWTGEYGLFRHFARRNSTWPPLSLALLGAMAEQQGHKVVIVDGQADDLSEDQMVERALSINPDVFGLTCYSPFFHLNVSLAKRLKKATDNIPIIVGGPHITITKENALLPQFDYLFIGEAEKSLPNFLNAFQKGADLSQVEGIIYKKSDKIIIGRPQWVETTIKLTGKTVNEESALDQFPFPSRHLLPMKKYKLGTMDGRMHFTPIQTMRGCPWKCIFCASEALNTTRVVTRSPRSVVNEIKQVITDFPYISHFYFLDDVLTLFKPHIIEICDLLIAENVKITFEGSTRANLVDDELVEHMVKAGLVRLSFGLETVDTEMRKTMKKKVPLEAYSEANKICEKHGVEAINSAMIGLPGETRESVNATLDWLSKAREIKQVNFAIAIPYPGTEFNDMAMAGTHGVELTSKDFSEYRRYGSAVTKVGDLSPQDLIDLQNEGFVRIYSAPWRWIPMFKKHGFIGYALMLVRVFKLWSQKLLKRKSEPYGSHPKAL
ncbi:MAG: radical SAM protein [Patescibacteria group bacterium]